MGFDPAKIAQIARGFDLCQRPLAHFTLDDIVTRGHADGANIEQFCDRKLFTRFRAPYGFRGQVETCEPDRRPGQIVSIPRLQSVPRVLLVTPGFIRGGPIVGVWTLAQQLCAKGLRPDVLALDGTGTLDGRRVQISPDSRRDAEPVARLAAFNNPAACPLLACAPYDVIHTTLLRPDVVSAMVGPWLKGARTVSTVRSRFREELAFSQGHISTALISRLWLSSLARKDLIIPHSDGIFENLAASGLDPARMAIVNNGVDTARFHPPTSPERIEARKKLGLPPDKTVVLHVGRLTRLKRVDMLLRALSEKALNDVWFASAGDGEEAHALRSLSASLGIESRTRWLGFEPDVRTALAAADICAMPSQTEGLSRAALEAGAVGLAVIAADIPGFRPLILDGVTGLLVPPNDPSPWARALESLCNALSRRKDLGGNLRRHIEDKFSAGAMASQYLSIYRTLSAPISARCTQLETARATAFRDGRSE